MSGLQEAYNRKITYEDFMRTPLAKWCQENRCLPNWCKEKNYIHYGVQYYNLQLFIKNSSKDVNGGTKFKNVMERKDIYDYPNK